MNIEELRSYMEWQHIEQWLNANVSMCHGPIENFRFHPMQALDDLDDAVLCHARGYDCRGPFADDGLLGDGPYAGFYGDVTFDVLVRKDDIYICPYDVPLLEGLPIFVINKSPLAAGGREKVKYIAQALVSETPPRVFIVEQTQRFRCKVFMFAKDFPDLWASVKMRQMLTAA